MSTQSDRSELNTAQFDRIQLTSTRLDSTRLEPARPKSNSHSNKTPTQPQNSTGLIRRVSRANKFRARGRLSVPRYPARNRREPEPSWGTRAGWESPRPPRAPRKTAPSARCTRGERAPSAEAVLLLPLPPQPLASWTFFLFFFCFAGRMAQKVHACGCVKWGVG